MPSANTDSRVRPPPEKVLKHAQKVVLADADPTRVGRRGGQLRADPVHRQHRRREQQLAAQVRSVPRGEEALEHLSVPRSIGRLAPAARTNRMWVTKEKTPHRIRRPSFVPNVGVVTVFRSLASLIRRRSARSRRDQRTSAPSIGDAEVSAEVVRGIEALQQMLLTETMYRRLLERDDKDDHPCPQ